MHPRRNVLTIILRWVVGATFLFSGLAKGVDPVGTSIYVEKYLATYSLEALMPISEALAVALSVVEALLGVLLIMGTMRRITTIISLVVVAIFTVVTLLSATVLPIGECGCFGSIVMLTPWQTFFKNLVLLALCFVLLRGSRDVVRPTLRDGVVACVAIIVPLSINLYALRHLPLVDSMPYKVSTALYDAVGEERNAEESAVQNILIFRNLTTGEDVEFSAADTACWEDANLEFVEAATRTAEVESLYSDFRLYNADGEDCTLEILGREGRVALLCVNDIEDITNRHMRGVASLKAQYPSCGIVVLTAVDISDIEGVINTDDVEVFTIDAMTLRSVIRSDVGVVVLRDGVVEFKADIRDI